jgi:hypothetical protein
MSRKRVLTIALPVIAVLAIAGGAIAATKPVQATATSVSAEFSTSSVSKAHTITCTAKSGDAFQQTSAIYKGTATGTDPRLTGPITIKATSFLDTTSGLGRIAGTFVVGTKTNAAAGVISGVISGGAVSGLAVGNTKGPAGQLVATVGGTFAQATGFQAASLGSATTGGGVVLHGSCPAPKKHKK